MIRDYRLCRHCLTRVPLDRPYCNKCTRRRVRLMRERRGERPDFEKIIARRLKDRAAREAQADGITSQERRRRQLEALERLREVPAPLPSAPTQALPGSAEKVLVMQFRAKMRQQLFRPDDAGMVPSVPAHCID